MSKRLQIQLADEDFSEIRRLAGEQKLSVGDWVRQALRVAVSEKPASAREARLQAIRAAADLNFGTGGESV